MVDGCTIKCSIIIYTIMRFSYILCHDILPAKFDQASILVVDLNLLAPFFSNWKFAVLIRSTQILQGPGCTYPTSSRLLWVSGRCAWRRSIECLKFEET